MSQATGMGGMFTKDVLAQPLVREMKCPLCTTAKCWHPPKIPNLVFTNILAYTPSIVCNSICLAILN